MVIKDESLDIVDVRSMMVFLVFDIFGYCGREIGDGFSCI